MYLELFMIFIRCGTFAFGGGNSAVLLIENEVVNKLGIMTSNDFANAYALGTALPGPIAAKLSILIGYQVGGLLGAFITITALVLPSGVIMIVVFRVYQANSELAWVKGMIRGVQPIVAVLMLQLFIKISKVAFFINVAERKHTVVTLLIASIALIIRLKFGVSPIVLFAFSMLLGIIFLS